MACRSSLDEAPADAAFTLVELLVVMIILGLLAAIAVPIFLSQRAKAHDAAVKADVSNLGKEVATYFIGASGPIMLDYASSTGRVILSDGSYTTSIRLTTGSQPPPSGASVNLNSSTEWCVALTDPAGSQKTFNYSGLNGLRTGTC